MNTKHLAILIIPALFSACNRTAESPPPQDNDEDTPIFVVVDVKDGDTIELDDGRLVRLVGIDTPEMNYGGTPEPCAIEAKEFAVEFSQGKSCYLVTNAPVGDAIDGYGRTLAFVHILPDSACMNVEIVRAGWSIAWDRYPIRSDYWNRLAIAEGEASADGRGIWDAENNCR